MKYKKILATVGSVLMLGATAAGAFAASYPTPFSTQGAVVVVGADAAASDMVAATSINNDLAGQLVTGTGTVVETSGDSYKIERGTNTRFHLGKGALDVVSGTLTGDDLGTVLKDGNYMDGNNDEFEYTQKIALSNLTLSLFEDSDYKSDVPTVGIRVGSGINILNYTLEFSTNPKWGNLSNTEIEIMGKTYYISSVTANSTLNLLDAANAEMISEGETKTVNVDGTSYLVEINALSGAASAPKVKLSVNGELTNSLSEGNTYKLSDGTYIGIKDISMRDVAGTTASVEFSIGSGKIELRAGGLPVRINDATINGLTSNFTNSYSSGDTLNKIILNWNADNDEFATEDQSMTMPGLENVKVSFTGMNYDAEEVILVEKGSNTYMQLKSFPLKDGNADINLMYGNGTIWQGTGKESGKSLLTNATANPIIVFDADNHEYFVASYDDGTNKESYLMRATSFGVKSDGLTNTTAIQYWKDGGFVDKKAEAAAGDTINLGSVSVTLGAINRIDKTVVIDGGTSVYFDRVFSKEGLLVYLPIENSSVNTTVTWPQFNTNATAQTGANVVLDSTSYILGFREADKTDSTTAGNAFNATLGWTSGKTTVSAVSGDSPASALEIGDTEVYRSFVYGELATELLLSTNGDQDSLKIVYHGGEAYGEAYVSEAAAVQSASEVGTLVTTDAETAKITGKNLIVVGGSCINSVAADLLGGALCGEAFTTATGVGAGQFLVQSFAREGKVALLVAGYEADDTTKAATYLVNQYEGSTDVGTKEIKSSTVVADVE